VRALLAKIATRPPEATGAIKRSVDPT